MPLYSEEGPLVPLSGMKLSTESESVDFRSDASPTIKKQMGELNGLEMEI